MIELLKDYGLFLAKAVTIVIAVMMVASAFISAFKREREGERRRILVEKLNHHFEYLRDTLRDEMLSPFERKQVIKERKREFKAEKKKAKREAPPKRKKVFVLKFKGDMHASAVMALREEITAILTVSTTEDEVLVQLESNGGTVNSYGLAASQLQRLRERKIPLTIAVDKVAASGGYMMAAVGDRIIAAPFAIIGSIGVISQVPNFHRLLKKHEIDFEEISAGEFKRTLSIFGENTEQGRQKFTEQIEDTHAIFKEFVAEHRSQVDISTVSTGEYWYGKRALDLQLIDEIVTSDDYLLAASENCDVYEITFKPKETLRDKIAHGFEQTLTRVLLSWWGRLESGRSV